MSHNCKLSIFILFKNEQHMRFLYLLKGSDEHVDTVSLTRAFSACIPQKGDVGEDSVRN